MKVVSIWLVSVALIFLSGVSVFADQEGIPEPTVLRWGVYFDLGNLDPHTTNDAVTLWLSDNIYETLVRYGTKVDDDGEVVGTTDVVPWLAESWETAPDKMTYVFHVRKGVKFHDGTQLDAQAVKYSINRVLTLDLAGATVLKKYIGTNSITVLDDYTVQIELLRSCSFFLQLLAEPKSGAVMSPTFVEGHGGIKPGLLNDYTRLHTCGTGPFTMGEWVPGESFVLEKNSNYWGEPAELDRVIFKIIADFSAQYLMFLSGELDICYRLPADMIEDLMTTPGVTIRKAIQAGLIPLFINNTIEPFDNVLVRRALKYAIDPREVNEAAVLGLGTLSKGYYPRSMEAFSDEFYDWGNQDIEQAKALLAEAGYPDGFSTEIYYNSGNNEREQICVTIQQQLKAVVINAEIRAIAWPTYVTSYQEGTMPLFTISQYDLPFVEPFLKAAYHSTSMGAGGNYTFYENPRVDQLIETLSATMDLEERASLIHEIHSILAADVPQVPLYEHIIFYVQRDWVKGWVLYPAGRWYFQPVHKSN